MTSPAVTASQVREQLREALEKWRCAFDAATSIDVKRPDYDREARRLNGFEKAAGQRLWDLFIQHADLLLAALSSPQGARPTWQPIDEHTPKDWNVMLGRKGFQMIGRWGDYCINNAPRFTHWAEMLPDPLPDPPLPAPSSAPPPAEEK